MYQISSRNSSFLMLIQLNFLSSWLSYYSVLPPLQISLTRSPLISAFVKSAVNQFFIEPSTRSTISIHKFTKIVTHTAKDFPFSVCLKNQKKSRSPTVPLKRWKYLQSFILKCIFAYIYTIPTLKSVNYFPFSYRTQKSNSFTDIQILNPAQTHKEHLRTTPYTHP